MNEMNDLLAEATQLSEAATPGPWHPTTVASIAGGTIYDEQWAVASVTIYDHDNALSNKPGATGPGYINPDANGRFIARSRTMVPELVAEVTHLQAQLAEYAEVIKEIRKAWFGPCKFDERDSQKISEILNRTAITPD